MNSGSYQIKDIATQTGIQSQVITISIGGTQIRVYTHGSTNEIHSNGEAVTAQWPLEQQLVNFHEVWKQRGGNPFMGPFAGRVGDENDPAEVPQRIAQPGVYDIHGVYAGLKWEISEISTDERDEILGYIELKLNGETWKNKMVEYYYEAARNQEDQQAFESLKRLMRATVRRFPKDKFVKGKLTELTNYLATGGSLRLLAELIVQLVDFAYPGNADLTRRISIEKTDSENVMSVLDEVWIQNKSTVPYLDASGFHTYFNTTLSEVVLPRGFWDFNNGIVPEAYDDNLIGVSVRVLDQQERLGRTVFIIPEGDLQDQARNQILFTEHNNLNNPVAAVENWWQKGNGQYPDVSNPITQNKLARLAIRIISVTGEVPQNIIGYVNEVNRRLGAQEI